ncbi:MAG TPA: hypothetical protein VJN18_18355 [Polyangiaceae bacterium]|nr:hypothetical protein [Polyangiaceae bacterium]
MPVQTWSWARATARWTVVGWGPLRHLISKGGSLYSRLLLGAPVRDMTTGFKAYTRGALERLDIGSIRSNGYAFQIETTHRAAARSAGRRDPDRARGSSRGQIEDGLRRRVRSRSGRAADALR